jgi:predicted GTPase
MTFVNEPRAITHSYRRFVTKKIKEHYGLMGIPVRLYAKKRTKHNRDTRSEIALAIQDEV